MKLAILLASAHLQNYFFFAGLDPSVRQSGNFNATNTKISKRGSKYLRYAINRAAQLIIWNDDTFYQYYTTKLAQGKSYLNKKFKNFHSNFY